MCSCNRILELWLYRCFFVIKFFRKVVNSCFSGMEMNNKYDSLWLAVSLSHTCTHYIYIYYIYRGFLTRMVYLYNNIEGFRPEWCISTIYHA